jgi:hypothetical protein
MPRLNGLELIQRVRGFISNQNRQHEKIELKEPFFAIVSDYNTPVLQTHLAGHQITTLY